MIDERELEDSVHRWCEGGLITGDQAARIVAFEKAVQYPRPSGVRPTHTSLVALFADVRAFVQKHPGATVLPADDPMTRQLGWVAFKMEGEYEHSERFSLSLTSVKAALAELPPDDPLRSEMTRPEGRQRIAARLMAEPAAPV